MGFGPQVFLIPESVGALDLWASLSPPPRPSSHDSWSYGMCPIMPCFKNWLFFSQKVKPFPPASWHLVQCQGLRGGEGRGFCWRDCQGQGRGPGPRQRGETVQRRLRFGDSSEAEGWPGRGPAAMPGNAEKGPERHELGARRQGACSCLGRLGSPRHGEQCLRDPEDDAVGRGRAGNPRPVRGGSADEKETVWKKARHAPEKDNNPQRALVGCQARAGSFAL